MMSLNADAEYRLAEQHFVEGVIRTLHNKTEDDYVSVFGYLAATLVGFLSGNHLLVQPPDLSWIDLPEDPKKAHEVTSLLAVDILWPTFEFCNKTEPSEILNQDHANWVLMRICDKLLESVRARTSSNRNRQNLHSHRT